MKLQDLHEGTPKTVSAVTDWLNRNNVRNAFVRPDLSIDVNGDVYLQDCKDKILPVKFNKITGEFLLGFKSSLTSLKGLPSDSVAGLLLSQAKITSLEGCPRTIIGDLNIKYCDSLKSLKGGPKVVRGDYKCTDLDLQNLEGLAEEIQGTFSMTLSYDRLPLLDLLRVKGLEAVKIDSSHQDFDEAAARVDTIINEWLAKPYGMARIIGCQSEMIERGYERYADMGEYE